MSAELVSMDNDTLRQRVVLLEKELEASKTEAINHHGQHHSPEAHKKAEHAHHAAANRAQYGHSDNIIFVEPQEYEGFICTISHGKGVAAAFCRQIVRYKLDRLLQRPVLHQWLVDGKIYREASERQSSRFELFFDLLFVGIVHQIADSAADEPTGIGFAKYILTFAPAFSIWADVRDLANQFANDDVTQRAYILWTMILLVGYSNNASSIEWGVDGEGVSEGSMAAMRWTLGFFVIAKVSKGQKPCIIHHKPVTESLTVILHLIYGIFLPLSRKPLLISSAASIVTAILFLVAMFTPLHGTISLVAAGVIADYLLRILGVMIFKTLEVLGRRRAKAQKNSTSKICKGFMGKGGRDEDDRSYFERTHTADSSTTAVNEPCPLRSNGMFSEALRKEYRIPAINIEHHVERLGAFVTIVLGEMVANIFFKASNASGLDSQSGRALLGLMIAFNLNWMYFDSQACKHFVHALRRHWVTSFLFTLLHLPLCMALLLASAAMNRLVASPSPITDSGGGLVWFFGAGLGISVITMASIGVLHKSIDDGIPGAPPEANASVIVRRTFSRRVVLATRYAAGVAMVFVPLAKSLSSIELLAIYVGITAFLIIEETVGRIERHEWELEDREEAREAEKAEQDRENGSVV
ncbi:hypothetical protein HWV62_43999 [Athelia sp. TMB]|nr:hypothetical protein HWV62_43999 [Athelia sp. TMB]